MLYIEWGYAPCCRKHHKAGLKGDGGAGEGLSVAGIVSSDTEEVKERLGDWWSGSSTFFCTARTCCVGK